MSLDFLVGGMPRGGTTVAAKLMSLHPHIFCYAGETHLIPFMHSMLRHLPCNVNKVDLVIAYLRQQFMTAMVEMPRFSVSQGAHPGNLIFDEASVDSLVDVLRIHLNDQLYGVALYEASLSMLKDLLAKADSREILGEKTPNNIFAMADYATQSTTTNVIVMREPFGVLRSMQARVDGKDVYANIFDGTLEVNIGMYLEYAMAARRLLESCNGILLVRYEDMAKQPASVVQKMFQQFGRAPDSQVIEFVEGKWNKKIADRAPMNYRRLTIKAGFDQLMPIDIWKILELTRAEREFFGYSDDVMSEFGFEIPTEFPEIDLPTKLFTLYGFHPSQWIGGPYMKQRSGLIAYFTKSLHKEITLELKSNFPEEILEDVELSISVNRIPREKFMVSRGKQITKVNLKIHRDDILPAINYGGYITIDLVSSLSYCEIAHKANGHDAREISFQLVGWKFNN